MKEENKNTEDETYQQEEFALPKDIEKYAYFWEIWLLKLDKYIDPKYQPKKHRYSIYAGLVLCALVFMLLLLIGITSKTALSLLKGSLFIGVIFLWVNNVTWSHDRISKQVNISKESYDCGCDRSSLPPFGESGWFKKRLIAHYTCTLYELMAGLFVGWLFVTILLLILHWFF